MNGKISKLFLTIFTFLVGTTTSVKALENTNTVDFSKKGNITITLKDNEKEYIEGAEIALYHIANATEKNYNLTFEYTEELKECEANLTNLEAELLPEEIEKCITKEISNSKQITDNSGTVKFNDLTLGIYLVTQTNRVEGYSVIDSFLVMLPKTEDNKWIYDVTATPKTEPYKVMDINVVKVWNTKDNNLPNSVTIELYKGSNLIDTINLSEENNWTYTWSQIEKSDEYKVVETNIPAGYTATYRQVENKFIVTNTKTLVQTGRNILIIELLAALGIIFIMTGFVFEKRAYYE